MLIENTAQIRAEDNLVMIVYGRGGVGKTTFAATAPKPLIIDFENGTKYLGSRGYAVDVIRPEHWFSTQEQRDLAGLMNGYETIVLDPLGEMMDKIISSPYLNGSKYRQGDGSPTMAGWGEVKKQMRNFIKMLRDQHKNVIIVSHVSEVRTESGLEKRIQVATKMSDELPTMVDMISYMGIQKKDEEYVRVLYTPAQGGLFDSKDRLGRVPEIVEVSEGNGFFDLLNAMRPLSHEVGENTFVSAPSQPQSAPQPVPPQTQPVYQNTPAPQSGFVERMTIAQTTEMRNLAQRMQDPNGKNYLLKNATAGLSYSEAQNIIDRAKASLGVA